MENSNQEDHNQQSEAASKLNLYAKLTQLVSKYETLNQEIYEFKLPDSIHCSEEIISGGNVGGEPINHWISFYDYDNYEYFAIEQFQKEHQAFLNQLKRTEEEMEKNRLSKPKDPGHSPDSYNASISSNDQDYSLEMFYSVSDSFPSMMN